MIVIVTDSSAYLTREEAERLGAVVVPMTYSYGGSPALTETYVDENGAFDRLIDRYPEQMHTSQAPMSAFVSAFADILEEGNEVLCITISSRMSGTYSNAVFAARELAPERICVVDSLNTAAGMYQLVKKAREIIPMPVRISMRRLRLYGKCAAGSARSYCGRHWTSAPQRQNWQPEDVRFHHTQHTAYLALCGWRHRILRHCPRPK